MLGENLLIRRNAIMNKNIDYTNSICRNVLVCLNVFVYLSSTCVVTLSYYDDITKYSLQNYTGYNSYFIPQWWTIIVNCMIHIYMFINTIWLVFNKDIPIYLKLIDKVISLICIHNILRVIEYIIYMILASNTNKKEVCNYICCSSIISVVSASIVGIDLGIIYRLRTFYYGDSDTKIGCFDIPMSALFSWSILDFIIQLNNMLNVYNWGYNNEANVFYIFLILLFAIYFTVLIRFRNIFAFIFYLIVLIGYGEKLYNISKIYETNSAATMVVVCIFISLLSLFGYLIYYAEMSNKHKRLNTALIVDRCESNNDIVMANISEIGGPLDELS